MEKDSVDAGVIKSRVENRNTNVSFGTISIPIDSITYNMKNQKRGKFLIFNHQTFDRNTGCRPRLGSDRDADALAKCFHKLDFEIIHYVDRSIKDIREELIKVSVEDHSNHDCIAIAFLTHGDEQMLWARDHKYPIDMIFTHFKGDRCPSLLGKPKIFIIQACRGDKIDSGVRIMSGEDVIDGKPPVYRIPTIADFVVYYSTAPGHYSFRNTENGSIFIQTLVTVLNEYAYKYCVDLLTLFTIINQRVAYYFESNIPNNKDFHKKKQIPCISSMLTRLIYLAPKPIRGQTFSTQF